MKFILIVFVFAVLVFMLRGTLARRRHDAQARDPVPKPQAMLSCAQCGLHLPRDDALPGRGGVFCSTAHRAAYEQSHPAS